MKKKGLLTLLVLSMFMLGIFLTGCIDATVDPDTLNLNNRGRGVVTAYVTSDFDYDVESVAVGYGGEWATSLRWSVEDDVLIVKVDRAELIAILKGAGVAEDVFEEFVDLDIKADLDDYGTQQDTHTIRVINPANAKK